MYHPHADQMVQMAMGMMGFWVTHPRDTNPLVGRVDRDFCFLLGAFDIEPGSYTPKVATMTDFNSRIFPSIDSHNVRLLVENRRRLTHEITLGTQAQLREHLEPMKKFPGMEHDEPSSVTLQPGEKGEIAWRFARPGEVDFGCLIPGHYEAGMKGAFQLGRRGLGHR